MDGFTQFATGIAIVLGIFGVLMLIFTAYAILFALVMIYRGIKRLIEQHMMSRRKSQPQYHGLHLPQ